jgi:hypothetical protein
MAKKSRRFLALVLTLVLAFSLLPIGASPIGVVANEAGGQQLLPLSAPKRRRLRH